MNPCWDAKTTDIKMNPALEEQKRLDRTSGTMPAVEVDEYLSTSMPYDVPSSGDNGSCNNEWKAMKVGNDTIDEERPKWLQKVGMFLGNIDWTASLLSLIVFAIVCAVGITLACTFAQSALQEMQADALDTAIETGYWFSSELDRALTPLFSLAQFATQIEAFRDLPMQVGAAGEPGSLPLKSESHRNVTGVCDDTDLVKRFDEIASEIKRNAKMPGVLVLLELLPQAVVCLLHPLINTEDFPEGVYMNNTGILGLDLLSDPKLRHVGERTVRSEEVVIDGPMALRQKGHPLTEKAFVARLPIEVPYHEIEVGGIAYKRWGFAVVKLNWAELVSRSHIYDHFRVRGFEFQLTRTDHINNEETGMYDETVVVLTESTDYANHLQHKKYSKVSTPFMTSNREWKMSVIFDPTTPSPWFVWLLPVSVVVSACIAWLMYKVLRQNHMVQKLKGMALAQESTVKTERNMTAYFAHELRNPLGAIDSALQAMPNNLPREAVELVSGMQLCSKFMTSLMNNLMDIRKMEEGKLEFHLSPLQLEQSIQEVHKMYLPSVKPGVDFMVVANTKQGGGINTVMGDVHRFEQVITNIVSNAIKYTGQGSIQLSIGWTPDKNMVKFECADTGPGIPKADQDRLFERFVKRGGAPGSGLGLAIAKHVVELMGGKISVESDPQVQRGSTFVVLLPLKPCKPPKEAKTSIVIEPIQEELSFLICDDIKMNRMMLERRFLKGVAPNAKITQASTGEESVQRCERESFDVIIMDQYMEEAGGTMLGTDTVMALKRLGISSLIIGCSGNDMEQKFKDAGATYVWKKPLPSNSTIIEQLRKSLPGLNGTSTTTTTTTIVLPGRPPAPPYQQP